MTVTQRIQLILRPRQATYLYANQPGRTLYLQLCWQEKPQANGEKAMEEARNN